MRHDRQIAVMMNSLHNEQRNQYLIMMKDRRFVITLLQPILVITISQSHMKDRKLSVKTMWFHHKDVLNFALHIVLTDDVG